MVPAYRQGPAVQLTHVNESLMSQYQLGAVEELTYDSFDGKNDPGLDHQASEFRFVEKVSVHSRYSRRAACDVRGRVPA